MRAPGSGGSCGRRTKGVGEGVGRGLNLRLILCPRKTLKVTIQHYIAYFSCYFKDNASDLRGGLADAAPRPIK